MKEKEKIRQSEKIDIDLVCSKKCNPCSRLVNADVTGPCRHWANGRPTAAASLKKKKTWKGWHAGIKQKKKDTSRFEEFLRPTKGMYFFF